MCFIATAGPPQAAPAAEEPKPETPSQQCTKALENALADKNPDTRKQAVVALSLAGATEPWLSMLTSSLNDSDVEVRLAAVASLSDLKNRASTTALHKALEDDVPEVSYAAAKALYVLRDPAGKKALLAVASGETKTSSNYFNKQKRDALRMLHTPRTMFLFAVKQGVGFVPVPGLGEGIASMEALLADPGMSGRAGAVLLLGKERDAETLHALLEALTAREWSTRAAAVHAIALRDDPSLRTNIFPLRLDKSLPVRLRAASGYLRLDSIRSRPRRRT